MATMGTHTRQAEGPGWEESSVCVPLAGAQGGSQVGDVGSESDDKTVPVVDFAGMSLTLPAAPSFRLSLFSHGGLGGKRVKEPTWRPP